MLETLIKMSEKSRFDFDFFRMQYDEKLSGNSLSPFLATSGHFRGERNTY